MRRDFAARKRVIRWTLGAVVFADLALAAYSLHVAGEETSPKQQLDTETRQYKLLRAEIDRAEKIRKDIPTVQQECDRFERELPPASTGYSVVVGELGELVRKSGLKMDTLNFRQKDVEKRPLSEILLEVTVNGDYPRVVRLVNSLQKSQSLLILDELTLASETQAAVGQLRVSLHLRTYFRNA